VSERKRPEPIPVGKIELANFEEDARRRHQEGEGIPWKGVGGPQVLSTSTHEEMKALRDRVEQLEYALSGVQLQASQLVQEKGEEKKPGIWREVYRLHNPEIKGHGIIVTTQERKEGHVVEHGYFLELWDNGFDPPEIRIRRMKDAKSQEA
jgi:hypothetical protein